MPAPETHTQMQPRGFGRRSGWRDRGGNRGGFGRRGQPRGGFSGPNGDRGGWAGSDDNRADQARGRMNSQGNTWNRDQAGQNQEPQAGSGGQDNSKWDQAAEKQGENSGTNTEKSGSVPILPAQE